MYWSDVSGDDFHVDLQDDKTYIGDRGVEISSVSMFLFEFRQSLTEGKFGILLFGEGIIEHDQKIIKHFYQRLTWFQYYMLK